MDNTKEYIICAAIHYQSLLMGKLTHHPKNVDSGFVVCGHRHSNIIELTHKLCGFSLHDSDIQGFLTSKNRFINRKEATIIAREANQLSKPHYEGQELYSENIY